MRHIVIVGGSKGIGASILQGALNDCKVTNISRSEPEIQHENLAHITADVLTDELPDIDGIDALIYCPGSITLKPINSLKEEDFISDYRINVIGAINTIKKYHKVLKKGTNPSIVLFSTVAVSQGMPFHSSIAAAKAGVEAVAKSLAAELAPTIRVNCIAPSITDTSLASGILRSEKSRESLSQKHPLKKIIQPKEVAQLALFLMGDGATAITGQIIGVDGGMSQLRI